MKSNGGSINTVRGSGDGRCSVAISSDHQLTNQPTASSRMRSARKPLMSMGVVAMMGMLLSACTNPGTAALGTNVPLKPAPDLTGSATPGLRVWRSPDLAASERAASAYMIPPVTVYRGKGSFYSDLSPQDVDQVAAMLTQNVREEMGRHFKLVNQAGPGVVTISLILAKITPPHADYSAAGPSGIPGTLVGMPEGPGTTAGTLTVSGKFTESQTGALLVGFVAPVSPQVADLPRPGTPARALEFADAASHQFASDLVNAVLRQRAINQAPAKK